MTKNRRFTLTLIMVKVYKCFERIELAHKMENRWMNKNGKASAGTLIWIVLIAAVVYGGIKIAPPYIIYFMMKSEVEHDASEAHLYTDEQITKFILNRAKEFDIVLEEDSFSLERRDTDIAVSLHYKTDINFFDQYVKTLYFDIRTVKPIKTK